MDIIYLLSIYGLSFFIKESSGPFHIMSRLRNWLMTNAYVGVFFYKLFSCWFCTGCHASWIIYLLVNDVWSFKECLVWIFAGGAVSFIINAVIERISRDDDFDS